MKVDLRCFSTLVSPDKCNFNESTVYKLDDGGTVSDLLDAAGIPDEDVRITFVNGKIVKLNTVLKNGDRIGLAPAIGGM